jgi:hypothetical protein
MNGDHSVEIFGSKVVDHPVAKDAGIVHQNVEATELLDRLPYQVRRPIEVIDAVVIGDRTTACGEDLVNHLLRRALVGAVAIGGGTDIVDDDGGTFAGQREGLATADAASSAGDDGHPAR